MSASNQFRLSTKYLSNFTHSILHRGIEYPVLFYRWSLLSVEHTANCGAIVCIQRQVFWFLPTSMFTLLVVTAWSAGITWQTLNRLSLAQVLQLFIVVLCPRPKLCTGVSTVEFVWLDCSFPAHLLEFFFYTTTLGLVLDHSWYTLSKWRCQPHCRFNVTSVSTGRSTVFRTRLLPLLLRHPITPMGVTLLYRK